MVSLGTARFALGAPQSPRKLPHVQFVHLVFEGAKGNPQVLGGPGDVPAVLLKGPQNEIPLERVGRLLEQAVAAAPGRLQLREVELERQVLLGDVVLVADRDEPLDQVLELADITWPPVLPEHRHRRIGNAEDPLPKPGVVTTKKKLGELWDVVGALPQWRQLDRNDVDPVVE